MRALAAAEADGWNSWDGPLAELAAFAAANQGGCEATWGGPPPPEAELASHLVGLAASGVTWAVYGPPPSIDWGAFVAKLAGAARAVQ